MISFKTFITEEAQESNTLDHIEHNSLNGHGRVADSANMLDAIHKTMLGKGSSAEITNHFSGLFPVAFGKDRQGKFSVAHDPNVPNYSHEDIERNHKGDHYTIGKLKTAFDHLHKILPDKPGMFDGKMYDSNDVQTKKNMHNIVTKNITYSTPKNSATGKKISNAMVGVAVDGHHDGQQFQPMTKKVRDTFNDHPDVHHIDPTITGKAANYSPAEQQAFLSAKKNAEITYGKMKPEAFDMMKGHSKKLANHAEEMYAGGLEPTVDTYLSSLQKNKDHPTSAEQVIANRNHFEKALELHGHLRNAKNALMDPFHKNNEFSQTNKNGEVVEPVAMIHMTKGDSKGLTAKFGRS